MTNKPIGKVTQEVRFTMNIVPSYEYPSLIAIDFSELDGSMTFAQVASVVQVEDVLEVKAYVIRNTKENYPRQLGGYPVYAVTLAQICKAFNVPEDTSLNDIIFWEKEFKENGGEVR